MTRKILTYLCAIAVTASSCNAAGDCDPCPDVERVLIVYIAADNNLSGYEQEKIQALRDGWTQNENDRIIVYRDCRIDEPRLIEISNLAPDDPPREIASYPTENSANPETLARVINDVKNLYPADSYGLIVFSHASGWLPKGVYNEFAAGRIPKSAVEIPQDAADSRSVTMDGDNEMTLEEFASAIPDGAFDYIVLETCFMAGIEVAYELRNKTPYILASAAEIVDPGFAPAYPSAIGALFDKNLTEFGEMAFAHVMEYADNDPRKSSTLAVIRTSKLDALASFVAANCNPARTVDISEIQRFDRLNVATLFFDFEDYYGRLLDTDHQRAELARLIGECVVWKAATPSFMTQAQSYNGFTIRNHSGLTTYIPQNPYPGLNVEYRNLEWGKAMPALADTDRAVIRYAGVGI